MQFAIDNSQYQLTSDRSHLDFKVYGLQTARLRETTAEFKQEYARRAGIEGTLSEGVRVHHLRHARYIISPPVSILMMQKNVIYERSLLSGNMMRRSPSVELKTTEHAVTYCTKAVSIALARIVGKADPPQRDYTSVDARNFN